MSGPEDGQFPEEKCSGCDSMIDPSTCQCGEPIPGRCDNHWSVPMGCQCHLKPLDFEIEETPLEPKSRKLKVDRMSKDGNPIIKTDKGDVELVPGTRRIGVSKKDE